jgi:hypothetical protein
VLQQGKCYQCVLGGPDVLLGANGESAQFRSWHFSDLQRCRLSETKRTSKRLIRAGRFVSHVLVHSKSMLARGLVPSVLVLEAVKLGKTEFMPIPLQQAAG